MMRCLILAAAYLALLPASPSSFGSSRLLPFSAEQHARFLTFLKWILALGLVREVNALLNRWAENRWRCGWENDEPTWQWDNEIAVVTGGSKGIGASAVKKLASYGIRVAVLDLEPLSEDVQNGREDLIHYYRCDITSPDAVRLNAEAIRSDIGSPSILINNAGIGNANTILEVSVQRLRAMFDVNILSHWITVQQFLPDMIAKKKGHIMSTASLASFVGLAGMVDYSCAKAGLMAFHEGLTQELKHRYYCPQIKTTIVYPNWTRTRLIAAIEKSISSTRAPIMTPDDVAEAMVKQIVARKSGQLILGPTLAASIRALPIWLQEFIRDRMAQVVTVNATTAVA